MRSCFSCLRDRAGYRSAANDDPLQGLNRGPGLGALVLEVVGGTLTPLAGTGAGRYSVAKAARQTVNAWIRDVGEFDGVLDFDAVLRDPARPAALRAAHDSGDHLHPSDAGDRAMGDGIPLDLFR